MKTTAARAYACYLRYFPIKKWKKAISSRIGRHLEGVPLPTAYGFPIYTKFHDRTNRMGFQGHLGILPRFVEEVPRGACFIDIGANLGVITIMAAHRVGPQGRVLAFEPVAETFAALTRNVALNQLCNVTTLQMAVAARASSVRMTPPDPLHSGAARVADSTHGDVRAGPLSDIPEVMAAAARMPVYAKIDTEGYELEVLQGMLPLFQQRRIVSIIIEIDDAHLSRFGASAAALYARLEGLGYRPRLHPAPAGRHYDEIFDRVDEPAAACAGNISAR
ncbi:MAG: FkbM family methyltransferase [Pseudomonadales bacterium]